MGVKFKSPLELSGHRSILHTDAVQTLIVKVVSKTAAHPEQGNGSSSGYTIDGVEGAYLEFTPGNTYKFDQSDSSNSNHPLRFYTDAAKTAAYTSGVTTSGTPGNSGAFTQIIPAIATPPVLFYQCSAHGYMGSYVKFGTATPASSNTTYTVNSVTSGSNAIIRLTGSDSSTDDVTIAAGSNISISETGDTITIASTAGGSVSEAFKTISVAGQSNIVADSATDTLTFAAGNNVTLTTNATSDTITINAATTVSPSGMSKDVFTGNGSLTAFTLGAAVTDENNTWVFLNGVYQDKSMYSISGTTITFTTAPQSGYGIEVMRLGTVAVHSNSLATDTFTGNGSKTAYSLSTTPVNLNAVNAYISGLRQNHGTLSLSGSTLTFSTAPPSGSSIEISSIGAINATSLVTPSSVTAGTGITVTNPSAGSFVVANSSPDQTVALTGGTGISISGTYPNFTIANTLIDVHVSFNTPTGQSFTYTTPNPSSTGPFQAGSLFPSTTFTITNGNNVLSGTAQIANLPNGLSFTQSYNNTDPANVLTITITGVYPGANSLNTNLVISGLTATPPPSLTANYLVIAGGGGGGAAQYATGGGGGAGGYRTSYGSVTGGGGSAESSVIMLLDTNYTVTVGAGGSGSNPGSNSVMGHSTGTITSTGGGRGGYRNAGVVNGGPGGSGGGMVAQAGYSSGTSGEGARTASPVQGFNGSGQYNNGTTWFGGGGGGAGSKPTATYQDCSDGGNGLANAITGTSVTRGGGGASGGLIANQDALTGPGSGGTGGGGDFNVAGTANTGGGGGGRNSNSGSVNQGQPGGSGLVVMRYPTSGGTVTVGSGLTSTTTTSGSDTIVTFTAGTGTISFT